MNKSILGTILGTTLIAALKNKTTGSGQNGINMLDIEYGTENGQIKIIVEVEYWAPIVDKNLGRSHHEMNYECRVDWSNGSDIILQKLRKLQSYPEQWFQDNGYIEPDGECDHRAIAEAFGLPDAVFYEYNLYEILEMILPSRVLCDNWESASLVEDDLFEQAVAICAEEEGVDECYNYEESIPEKYIEKAVKDWEDTEWTKNLMFYFDVTEETIKYNDSDFRNEISGFLELIRGYFNNTLKGESLDYRRSGSPYRINQELSVISVFTLESTPNELPLIEQRKRKSQTIRRY